MAGITYSVEKDFKRVSKMFRQLPGLTEAAAVTALNKTATQVKGKSVKAIAKQTGLKQKVIREKLLILKASKGLLRAEVKAHPRRTTNLIEFVSKAKSKPGAFKKKLGVTAKVWGRRKQYKGTYIGTGRTSGKILVFKRGQNKSIAVRGPSIPLTFLRDEVQKIMDDIADTAWRKHFEEQLRRQLSRRGYL